MIKFFKTPKLVKILFFWQVWSLKNNSNTIYLTFDDGPHPDITLFILDFLKSKNIKATFFCVAQNVLRYPEIYKRIIEEGHQVGNHTFRHENAFKVSSGRYLSSVKNASAYIQSNLFRPPYGKIGPILSLKLAKKYKIIMWSWLSNDYDESVSVSLILEKAKKIQSGDIIVLHDNVKIEQKQKQLLPQLIEFLTQRGFKFDTINF